MKSSVSSKVRSYVQALALHNHEARVKLDRSIGKKMGKTENGAIWLDGSMLKPYDYWQYFRNVDDQDVGRFLRLSSKGLCKRVSTKYNACFDYFR